MTLLAKRRVLAVKTETTIGTAISLSASDAAFFAYDALIQNDTAMVERMSPNSFGTIASVPEGHSGTATFKTDLRWNGTGVPAYLATLFAACGVVNNSGAFKPKTEAPGSNVKTLTIGLYEDGKVRRIRGACGNFVMIGEIGKPIVIEWTFKGVWDGEEDTSIIDPTYPTDETVIRASGGATTYGGVSLCAASWRFDPRNDVQLRECGTTVAGFHAAIVADRKPQITIDPEAKLVATRATISEMLAMTEAAYSSAFDGPSTSTVTLAAPKAQVVVNTEAARKGLVIDQLTLQCNKDGNTEDNDFSLTFA
jgi:hypothetical protein